MLVFNIFNKSGKNCSFISICKHNIYPNFRIRIIAIETSEANSTIVAVHLTPNYNLLAFRILFKHIN